MTLVRYSGDNKTWIHLTYSSSASLVSIASTNQPNSTALVADSLLLPHPSHSFDFAISIAVVHHFSTRERRVEAVKTMLNVLRRDPQEASDRGRGGKGKALIYVWALEQKNSRRGWDEGGEQDIMVPWVMKGSSGGKPRGESGNSSGEKSSSTEDRTFNRYYHLYRKGELEEDVVEAGGVVLEGGWERDNWWVIAALK